MEQLALEAGAFDISLDSVQLEQFSRYQELLLVWNERMNLTAVREPAMIQRRHFLDSLTCATVTGNLDDCSLIDVGTGAGFPGLPLKIRYPAMRLTLVESVRKKTRFLEAVVAELGLAGVQIVAERAELLGQQPAYRGRYDWAVARAVAELRVLVEYLLPLCRIGGHALAQKGQKAAAEIEAAATAIATLGGSAAKQYPVQLPDYPPTNYLIVIQKTAATPARYPRRPGMPGKRPL